MSDTTNETATDSDLQAAAEFIGDAADLARKAGVPDAFDDSTAVFIHRTAAQGGYVLVAFDPVVLVKWAESKLGFGLVRAGVQFLPMGMPVLSVELEDKDAIVNGEDEASGSQEHQADEG